MRYIFPCELASRKIVPSIRAGLVLILQNKGMSQREISSMLNMTPAAVSQYVSKKRGKLIDVILSDPELSNMLEKIADMVVGGNTPEEVNEKVCYMCELIRKKYPATLKTFPY